MRLSFAALTLLAIAGAARAQCYTSSAVNYAHGYQSYSYGHANYNVVKEVVKVKELVPVAVYVPAYAAVYVPGYTPPPTANPNPPPQSGPSELQQVLSAVQGVNTRITSIDDRLRAVEEKVFKPTIAPPAPPPNPHKPPDKPPDPFGPKAQSSALGVFTQRCAACHDSRVAADKGGEFILTVGGRVARLDDAELRKIGTRVANRTMPPPKTHEPLTDEERQLVAAFVANPNQGATP